MALERFSMGEAISFGWVTMKSNIGFFIGLLMIALLIENLPGFVADFAKNDFPVISALLSLTGVLIGIVVQMGLIKVSLKFCDGVKGKLDDLLSTFNLLLKVIVASIIYGLIIIGGTILFIIPGIIWGVKFCLFPYFIVDNGLGPIEAIKASGRATEGAKWGLFLFGFLLGLINIGGALFFLVGLFFTIPTSMVAYAYVYRELAGRGSGPVFSAQPSVRGTMYVNLSA